MIALLAALALAVAPKPPAPTPATPETFDAVWAAAPCGVTLALAPGVYAPPTALRGYTPAAKACAGKPIVLDATRVIRATATAPALGVTMVNWTFARTSGVTLKGGVVRNRANATAYTSALAFQGTFAADGTPTYDCADIAVQGTRFVGPFRAEKGVAYQPGAGYGLTFLGCRGIRVSGGVYLSGFGNAALFGVSSDIVVTDLECANNTADCMDFGQVWGVRVERVVAHDFRVGPLEHPDTAQFWSRAFYPNSRTPAPPSSDIVVRHVTSVSLAQGIFLGNHVRDYAADARRGWAKLIAVDDGGFDRVTIEFNDIMMNGGNAIGVYGGRDVKIRNNRLATFPGAPGLAGILVPGAMRLTRCGNVVADSVAGKKGVVDPPCAP